MSYQQYIPTSSLYLSLRYLQRSNYYGAYQYAVRLLEMEPYHCNGHLILSLIYSSYSKTKHHASFFYEIALEYNPSCRLPSGLFHDHHLSSIILSSQQLNDEPSDPLDLHLDAIRESINGKRTLYQIFLFVAENYPQFVSDFSISSFELFLQRIQLLLPLSQTCEDVSEQIIPIPTTNTRLNFFQQWPIYEQIAYVYNWPLVQNVFGETVLGLSDALSRLGIPNSITPSPSKLMSDEVIIKPVGGPRNTRTDLNYVIWNFEKNPNVAQEGDQVNIGFILNACEREESAYEYSYFTSSVTYWESIPTSILKWKAIQPQLASLLESVGVHDLPHLVPTFLPLTTIQFSILQTNFRGLFTSFPSLPSIFFLHTRCHSNH
jgi:hypothetical protein